MSAILLLMDKDTETNFQKIKDIIEEHFLNPINLKIDYHLNFFNEIKNIINRVDYFKQNDWSISLELIKKVIFDLKNDPKLKTNNNNLEKKLFDLITSFPEKIIVSQNRYHFEKREGDNLLVFSSKFFKNTVYKDPQKLKAQINYQSLYKYHFLYPLLLEKITISNDLGNIFIDKYSFFFLEINHFFDSFYNSLKSEKDLINLVNDLVFTLNEKIEEIYSLKISIKESILKFFNLSKASFLSDYKISGTFELKKNKLIIANKVFKKKYNSYLKTNKQINDNSIGIFNKFSFDLFLFSFAFNCFSKSSYLISIIKNYVTDSFINTINELTILLKGINDEVNQPDIGSLLNKKFLQEKKIFLKNNLENQILNNIIEKISENKILILIYELEIFLKNILSEDIQYSIPKNQNILLNSLQINYYHFCPDDLSKISEKIKFENKVKEIKLDINEKLKEYKNSIAESLQVAEYNLETAINVLEDSNENPLKIISEGLAISIKKIEDANLFLNNSLLGETILSLESELFSFLDTVLDLKVLEKFKALKSKLLSDDLQEKAKQKSLDSKKTFLKIKNKLFLKKDRYLDDLSEINKKFNTVLGIKEIPNKASLELKEYITKTSNIKSNLPLVYRNLFKLDALSDNRFFVERSTDLEKIKSSFGYWLQGYSSSLSIIAEKGFGVSTLINFSEKIFSDLSDVPIKKIKLKESSFCTIDELLEVFLSELNFVDNCLSLQDLEDSLNKSKKHIIIIENIQNLYIRKINGFKAIEELLKIISKTDKNIFWICTGTIYAWNYLEKVIDIKDHFIETIELDRFSDIQLKEIIYKRNVISGFDIEFLKPDKGNKLNDKKVYDQSQLEKLFFLKLFKITQGNISLSQIVWLRSIKSISKGVIEINPLEEFDLNFLNMLNDNKVFVLMSLLIHDGLSLESLTETINLSKKQVQLILISLLKNSILIEENNIYKINFIFYSYIVKLLKSRNIIH